MESQESTTSPVPRLEARDQGEYSLRFSGIMRRLYRTAAKAQAVKTVRLQAWRFKRVGCVATTIVQLHPSSATEPRELLFRPKEREGGGNILFGQ